ncbi:hypothetical protein EST38_g1533 [Candolleomyces aberdarensis]|uniref:Uncharacterized protein n=1 Tax=Candolleomyces aberdarensis TaxID=2316362 RepID=A0A4Q2DZ51_9AGAR|nr:hypothetical protein EST38_g1533 [Candolleomyces aberdarensis]
MAGIVSGGFKLDLHPPNAHRTAILDINTIRIYDPKVELGQVVFPGTSGGSDIGGEVDGQLDLESVGPGLSFRKGGGDEKLRL